jgi:hypothetical protein
MREAGLTVWQRGNAFMCFTEGGGEVANAKALDEVMFGIHLSHSLAGGCEQHERLFMFLGAGGIAGLMPSNAKFAFAVLANKTRTLEPR